jgi:hypothetical protein
MPDQPFGIVLIGIRVTEMGEVAHAKRVVLAYKVSSEHRSSLQTSSRCSSVVQ